jgi:argininosuccinate lyase
MSSKSRKKWSTRFSEGMDKRALLFGASISFDQRLSRYDIQGSLAYAKALQRAGLLSAAECRKIHHGLQTILRDIEKGHFVFCDEWEDIHLHVEKALIKKIGALGGKLHTGRSRNDQVATDLRLYCLDHLKLLKKSLKAFQSVLLQKAFQWRDVIIPGYTHLQRAQPILLAHHLLAYLEMLQRDEERVEEMTKRSSVMPLGSGALAGNAFQIDRKKLAHDLGFAAVSHNSLDAVSDRDFAVEICAAASLMMVHLSRFAEELILWSSQEFAFIRLPQSFCTGSSMMPQKVNPDIPELVRGKSGRVIGHLVSLLTVLKGLPLAYNKDLQEDKEALFDTFDTLLASLDVLTGMFHEVIIMEDAVKRAADDEGMLATDLADWLVMKKLPFREAHEIVGKLVQDLEQRKISLKELSLKDLKKLSPVFTQDALDCLSPEQSIAKRSVTGGTAKKNVLRELSRHKKRLAHG